MAALARVIAQGEADLVAAIAEDADELFRESKPGVDLRVCHREPDAALGGFVDTLLRQMVRLDVTRGIDFENFDFRSLLSWARDIPGYRAWVWDVTQLTCRWCDWHRTEYAVLRLRILDAGAVEEETGGLQLACLYGGALKSRRFDMARGEGETEASDGMYRVAASPDLVPPYAVAITTPKARQVLDFPRGLGQMPRRLLLTVHGQRDT
ncbi:DUF1826 domain-containing protein [Methylococcus sp. Mc7]|jgi:hypothetical protein|uniref:DUF1826 domain-containing protein n=1 Tax=Methylococcus sp. Mc7 TaxID=2860258 RepID=UPI001C52A8BD|nr:DUF1826 domain-containing protein [Methylococcus sp. Mc7]QXP84647.1 DUF1826 domain-containing protein [Methylococcus sp. Mc7]